MMNINHSATMPKQKANPRPKNIPINQINLNLNKFNCYIYNQSNNNTGTLMRGRKRSKIRYLDHPNKNSI